MQLIPLIYDILAAVIVAGCIAKGVKNGFAKTAILTVGYLCSAVAALVISNICASLIYSTAVEPMIVSGIESSVNNAASPESIVNSVTQAVENLPAISGLFFNLEDAAESLVESIGFDAPAIASAICETVIRPVVEPILETLIFVISLLILVCVVSMVAKGSKIVNEVPIIGPVNAFFGGVAGTVTGAIELCVASAILKFVISSGIYPEYFSEGIISETYLFKWIYFTVSSYFGG